MPNPRSMKRFVNSYSALRDVRIMEGNLVQREPLALWTILETRWPSLADYLRIAPEAIELLAKSADELEIIPTELRALFADAEVRRLADFEYGGPLTPAVINACCGVEHSTTWPGRIPAGSPEPGQPSATGDTALGRTAAEVRDET
jgi:hypothetical protein